jgi:lipoprotein-anchoring transpeptidase ErfK/SrfK
LVRSGTFIVVVAVVALLTAGAVGVYAFDKNREDRIAEGVTVGGVPVGDLNRGQATERLRAELLEPLSSPVVVRARGKRFRLSAREAKIAANIDAMVAEAVDRSRDGNLLSRTLRTVTGGEVQAQIEPRITYSSEAVGRLISRVKRKVERPAKNADVQFAAAGMTKVEGRDGLRVDKKGLRNDVERALLQPGADQREVKADVERVEPEVSTAELEEKYDTVVTVDRGAFTLRLFKKLKMVRSYRIAVGKVGLDTPAGRYSIQNKAVNPAWNVPNSDWAGDLAGKVIPGGTPQNPLKARWLGIYNGVGIHGTDARGSIGSNASHGCIRMLVEDVTELYDDVPVGATVYIA